LKIAWLLSMISSTCSNLIDISWTWWNLQASSLE